MRDQFTVKRRKKRGERLPSGVVEGRAYCWAPGLELDESPDRLPEPPAWLVAELDALTTTPNPWVNGTSTSGAVAANGGEANPIPEHHRNVALASLAGTMRRVGMTRSEILAALCQVNDDRCRPRIEPAEVERIATSIARYEPDQIATAMTEGHWEQLVQAPQLAPVSLADLMARYPDLRPPVIHGLLRRGETMNVISAPKIGKAPAIDTPILTEDGWTTMAELQPGMKVHTVDGTLTPVVAVSEILHDRPCYRVTTCSGASVVADRDHLWQVVQGGRKAIVATEGLCTGRDGRRWLLPIANALQRPERELPLDPWLLGYWLGNGTAREGTIAVNQDDLDEVIQQIQQAGFVIGKPVRKGGCVTFTIYGLRVILRDLGVLSCKHIPEAYLLGSHARPALLAGLLDADGHAATQANGSGMVEFTTTDQALFFPTLMLARSLGYKASAGVGRATLHGVDCSPKLRITFAAGRQNTPFRLSRRTAALPDREPSQQSRLDAVRSVGRGFRLHPSKANCLVLDFGGNVVRHGPVDQIRVKKRPLGVGEAPAKECPECHSIIAAGYARCPDCDYEFPPPERTKHDAKASEAGILSGEITTTKHAVRDVFYTVHTKRGAGDEAPKSMRVDYKVSWNDYKSEWICFEHTGYARAKAVQWWQRRSHEPVPATVAEAVEIANAGRFAATKSITVRSVNGEEFDRIIGYELGNIPPPLDDQDLPEDALDFPFGYNAIVAEEEIPW